MGILLDKSVAFPLQRMWWLVSHRENAQPKAYKMLICWIISTASSPTPETPNQKNRNHTRRMVGFRTSGNFPLSVHRMNVQACEVVKSIAQVSAYTMSKAAACLGYEG